MVASEAVRRSIDPDAARCSIGAVSTCSLLAAIQRLDWRRRRFLRAARSLLLRYRLAMSDIPAAKTYRGFALFWRTAILFVYMLCLGLFATNYVATGALAVLLTCYGIFRYNSATGRRTERGLIRRSKGRTFLRIAIILALLGLVHVALDGLLYVNPYYILCGLIALVLLLWAAAAIAGRRGWGSEGRLTRFLNRPRFVDESRRSDRAVQRMPGLGNSSRFRTR